VEAAIYASGKPGSLRECFLKLRKRKGGKIARVAATRKISTYVFHMLKEEKSFREVVFLNKSDWGKLEMTLGIG